MEGTRNPQARHTAGAPSLLVLPPGPPGSPRALDSLFLKARWKVGCKTKRCGRPREALGAARSPMWSSGSGSHGQCGSWAVSVVWEAGARTRGKGLAAARHMGEGDREESRGRLRVCCPFLNWAVFLMLISRRYFHVWFWVLCQMRVL